MRVDRIKQFSESHKYDYNKPAVEYGLQSVKMVNEDGTITEENHQVVIDVSEEMKKTPAYTTKIEYQEIYGTLDKNNIIQYKMVNPQYRMSPEEIMNLRNQIIAENIVEEKNEIKNQE